MKKTITICSLVLGVFCLGCSNDSTTTPTADRFTIYIAENEKGIVDPHGVFTVQRADSINIKTKNSQDGYRFLKWQITNGSNNVSVRDTAGDSTYIADIAGDAEIEAVFVIDTFDIIVTSDEHGNALVEDTFKVAYGEGLDISAGQSSNGYRFSHWVTGSDPNFSIGDNRDSVTSISNVTGDGTITCTFTPLTYTLVVEDPNPVAGGSIQGTAPGTYSHGDEIVLTAEPNLGWKLTGWNGVGETGESIAFNIIEDMTISADFDTIGVPQGVICVRHDAPQNGPGELGSNWVMAYQTLQEGLEASSEDAEIWVARGTYSNNSRFELKSGMCIYGGFGGYESVRTQRDDEENGWYLNPSVLDGDTSMERIIYISNASNITIDGFVIKNAMQNGIYNRGNDNRIKNCVFINININGNSGPSAIYIWGMNTIIENCVFTENKGNGGTAIKINGPNNRIVNSLFVKNEGPVISDNNANSTLPTKVISSTIWGNKTNSSEPAGITNKGCMELKGTILYGNENGNDTKVHIDTADYVQACCIEDTVGVGINTWYPNNTFADPIFSDTLVHDDISRWYTNVTSFLPTAQELKDRVDIGEPNDRPATDLRGNQRSATRSFDMGCYEIP